MNLSLVKMNKAEFEDWGAASLQRYAQDKVKANGLKEEEALATAQRDFERALPDGLDSKDNFLYCMKTGSGDLVGYVWYTLRGPSDNRIAWLSEIYIHADYRGKGHGKSAMQLFEQDDKSQGVSRTGLHVFVFNEAAICLYESMNYQTTDLCYQKTL